MNIVPLTRIAVKQEYPLQTGHPQEHLPLQNPPTSASTAAVSRAAILRTIEHWLICAGIEMDEATAREAAGNLLGLVDLLRELQSTEGGLT